MNLEYWIIEIAILVIVFWSLIYIYFTRKFDHWVKKNVPYVPPIPFFGNTFRLFTFKENMGEFSRRIYNATTKPFVGFFVCDEPYLLIREPELIKNILVKDFNIFSNRNITNNEEADPMGSQLLFLMKTPDWRTMRRKISPVFTSGKMKLMYSLINDCGCEMIEYLTKQVEINPVIDIREASAKYTTDAITSTSFGVNANCFKYEDSEFRKVSRRVFNWAIWERVIATCCYFVAPNLVKLFRLKFIDKASSDFLRDTFWKIMRDREEKKVVRNDLLDIIIELKKEENIDDPYKLEGDKIVAQATNFFIAGFETTSSTITFTLYELAIHKEMQEKLRREVKKVLEKHGQLSYDALKEMEYLDMCISETLRKYPPLPFLDRKCSEDYKIPGTDVVLEKGSPIFISVMGLHYDPQYFPNPDEYDPTRFTEENVQSRVPFTYLPFGEGPRLCIGARFGTVSSKSGVAHIISQFDVDLCAETQHPIKLDSKGFLLAPVVELPLKFTKL